MGALTQGQTIAISLGFSAVMLLGMLGAHLIRQRQAQQPPKPEPLLTGEPIAGQPDWTHRPALAAGAFLAVRARVPVDTPRMSKRRAVLPAGVAEDEVPETINSLLGIDARTVSSGLVDLEEILAQRRVVGPELWRHRIDEFAAGAGLTLAYRAELHRLAEAVLEAEEGFRRKGLLAEDGRVDTVAGVHWAQGVHLVRVARAKGLLEDAAARRWLAAADALVGDSFGQDWGRLWCSLMLPYAVHKQWPQVDAHARVATRLLAIFVEPASAD